MKKRNRNLLLTAGVLTGASALSYKVIAKNVYEKTFYRTNREDTLQVIKGDEDEYVALEAIRWYQKTDKSLEVISSFDQLKLCAVYLKQENATDTIILLHGYGEDHNAMIKQAKGFYELGFNCLIPDMRAHGESEGEITTFGLKESFDLLKWIAFLNEGQKTDIHLYGKELGAATVLMSLNTQLEENVKTLIIDHSYSTLEEIFKHLISDVYKFKSPGIVTKIIENEMHSKLGLSFKDFDLEKLVSANKVKTLFVHYDQDDLIPITMSYRLFNQNSSEKKFYLLNKKNYEEIYEDDSFYGNIYQFIKG